MLQDLQKRLIAFIVKHGPRMSPLECERPHNSVVIILESSDEPTHRVHVHSVHRTCFLSISD